MDLAGEADDGYQLASALRHAGIQMRDAGAYDDDLNACPLGLITLGVVPHDDLLGQEQLAWLHGECAIALAAMGHRDEAQRAIATAREWTPATTFDTADLDLMTAQMHLFLNRLDTAESMAAVSTRTFGDDRREGVLADIILATIHTRTREPDSTMLANAPSKAWPRCAPSAPGSLLPVWCRRWTPERTPPPATSPTTPEESARSRCKALSGPCCLVRTSGCTQTGPSWFASLA